MKILKTILRIVFILISSIGLTYFILNSFGRTLENRLISVYQGITGKQPEQMRIDSSGIPYMIYEGNIGKTYNVVTIAEYALRLDIADSLESNISFKNSLKWLLCNSRFINDSTIIFSNYFDWPIYKMKSPWRSAMSQGRAMQLFIKAFKETNDSIYLTYAEHAMNALFVPVAYGGVTYFDNNGFWYEEYADDNAPQSRVLNGMIVVLQALLDFYDTTGNIKAKFLFENGLKAVTNTIHLYNRNNHSNYDIMGKPASLWYHNFHIRQMEYLYNRTNNEIFKNYKESWEKYRKPSYFQLLIEEPNNIRLFIMTSVLFFCIFFGIIVVHYTRVVFQ